MVLKHENLVAPNVNLLAPNVNLLAPNVNLLAPNVNLFSKNEHYDIICQHCNKTFCKKSNLDKHSKICKGIINRKTCHYCNKIYASSASKCKHIRICKVRKEIESQALVIYDKSKELDTSNEETKIEQNNITQNANTINNTNNTTNNTVINQIIVFDPKNMSLLSDHISKKEFIELSKNTDFSKTLSDYGAALLNRTENQCIRKTNLKSSSSAIHVGDNKWEYQTDKYIYPKLLSKIADNFGDVKENFKVHVYSELETFIDDVMSEATDCHSDKNDELRLQRLYKKLFNNIKHHIFNLTKHNLTTND
jgi:hypothetical protein